MLSKESTRGNIHSVSQVQNWTQLNCIKNILIFA
nr:MAG TPA: hypothetical protein [Caudoviricetes sp.]